MRRITLYKKIGILIVAVVVSTSGFFVPQSYSATVTNAFDQPSSNEVSTLSNHQFTIGVASAVDEGDTLVLTFPTAFDTSSIVENDVDIADDGVDLTTAADCTGAEEASVAMAADVLTITICAGDGGAIAAASTVVIEIGLNAVASGTGANQITNPTNVATYFVNISGTFGDSGSILVPIAADGAGTVSATTPEPDDGGGGGDPPDPDPEPDPCEEDPESCEEPDPDPCDEDPESCEEPDPDPCDEDPESCEEPDPCDEDPESCEEPTPDPCDEDPESCEEPEPEPDPEPDDDGDGDGGEVDRQINVDIFAADGTIELELSEATYHALMNSEISIQTSFTDYENIQDVDVVYGSGEFDPTYLGEGLYSINLTTGSVDETLTISVTYDDGGFLVQNFFVLVHPYGLVYELMEDEEIPVEGAVVIVYQDGIQWGAFSYGQSNPVVTSEDGLIGWYVPNGTYQATAGSSGYEDAEVSITVTNNILTPRIELSIAGEIIEIPTEEEPLPPVEEVVEIVAETATAAVETVQEVIATIRENPQVQVVADIAKPAVIASVVGSAVILSASFNLLPFLQYLLSAPILFFARRRRQQFGIIYNAYTKVPIDLAIVRLLTGAGKLVRTMVTDKEGRYFFKASPGEYRIEIVKQGFSFPSKYLKGLKEDGKYLDLYQGQVIQVTDENVMIAANIPLDPVDAPEKHTPRFLIGRRFLKVLQNVIAISGIVVSLFVLVIQPGLLTVALFALQVVVYVLTRILAKPVAKKGWGIAYDKNGERPLSNTVVRLFEPKYNKLIESTVTDNKGRYAFLVGPNQYYVTFEKPQYDKEEIRPIDYSKNKEPALVSEDMPMQKAKK